MSEPKCANCSFRASYDKKPKSLLGRFWRWHINWCPGWKSYMKSLPEDKKLEIKNQYNINR
jgi:hypothetical protein